MAIACRLLYEDFSDSIGKKYGDETLQRRFVRAINMAMDDLSYDADVETNIPHIASIDDSIAIDGSYTHVMYTGLLWFAMMLGVRPADPKIAAVQYSSTEKQWERMKAQYSRSKDNANQPEQSDSMDKLGFLQSE